MRAIFTGISHEQRNEPSYTDNRDGTVTDNITGLMWQKVMDEKNSLRTAATLEPAAVRCPSHRQFRTKPAESRRRRNTKTTNQPVFLFPPDKNLDPIRICNFIRDVFCATVWSRRITPETGKHFFLKNSVPRSNGHHPM